MMWSIIICCYNSELRIRDTLLSLIDVLNDGEVGKFEVVIVNNASTDKTEEVVLSILEKQSLIRYKVIQENTPGLIHARLAGVKHSIGDYIAFIDDDNWVLPGYFTKAEEVFLTHLDVAVFGCSTRLPKTITPPTFIEPYLLSFAVGELFSDTGVVAIGQTVWGAGMAIRTIVAKTIFDPKTPLLLTGRVGSTQLAGDDSEMCFRAQLLGKGIWYENDVLLEHAISPARFNEDALQRMYSGFGASSLVLLRYRMFVMKQYFIAKYLFVPIGVFKVIYDIMVIVLLVVFTNDKTKSRLAISKIKSKIAAFYLNKDIFDAQSRYFARTRKEV